MSLHNIFFKPKYNVPNLWISKMNGGGIQLYSKEENQYTRVTIKPYAIPERIYTNKNSYFKFTHFEDFMTNYQDTIIQMLYMWILDLESHIQHLEKCIYKNMLE
jgi:hypothetical protein